MKMHVSLNLFWQITKSNFFPKRGPLEMLQKISKFVKQLNGEFVFIKGLSYWTEKELSSFYIKRKKCDGIS